MKIDIFFCIKIQTFVYRVTKFALVEVRRRYGKKLWCDKDGAISLYINKSFNRNFCIPIFLTFYRFFKKYSMDK